MEFIIVSLNKKTLMLKSVFLLIIAFAFISQHSFSQTPGEGCVVGNDVFTVYFGFYNNKYVYGNSVSIPMWYNAGNTGYKCGAVNLYTQSQYWDGSKIVIIPAQNEITSSTTNPGCVIATSLMAAPTGYGGDPGKITFVNNNPTYCKTTTTPLPLDSYVYPFILVSSIGSSCLLRNRLLKNLIQ